MRTILVLTAMLIGCTALAVRLLPDEATAGPAPTARPQEIRSIAIDGGRGLPLAALHARIATRAGELVDRDRLERDRAAVEAELEAIGYLAARVAAPTVTFGPAGAYVVFDVDRGPLFHLRAITVSGPGQRDAGVVTLAAGDDASRARIDRARQALAATLERVARTRKAPQRAHAPQVDVVLHTDIAAAALDVELITR